MGTWGFIQTSVIFLARLVAMSRVEGGFPVVAGSFSSILTFSNFVVLSALLIKHGNTLPFILQNDYQNKINLNPWNRRLEIDLHFTEF